MSALTIQPLATVSDLAAWRRDALAGAVGAGAPERPRRALTRPIAPQPSARPAALRLTMRGRWVLVLALSLLIATVGLMGSRAEADGPPRGLEVESYTVRTGDTLWALAADRAAPGADVRDVVAELQELNELPRAGLTAGEQIILPVRP